MDGPRYYDKDGKPLEMLEWAALFQDMDYKRIAYDEGENWRLSTVWLGLNHSFGGGTPEIFESMLFSRPSGEVMDMRRYSTQEGALKGHQEMLRDIKAGKYQEEMKDA